MRIIFFILILLHGLIHLLGFAKGWGLADIKQLSLPISRTLALCWLLTACVLVTYGILFILASPYNWIAGILAAIFLEILVILFWKDAKWGTVPNLIILVVSLITLGAYQFRTMVERETSLLLKNNHSNLSTTVAENNITRLPEPVQEWLRHSGAVGQPYTHAAKLTQSLEMQLKPGQKKWLSAAALQYTTIENPGFIWSVCVKMNSLLHFRGRDKFEYGRGEMLIRLNSLLKIVDARGAKIDEAALQRFLGEMVWFPSMALSPYISWKPIDDSTAEANMHYQGTEGSGRFSFNEDGDVIRYTAHRYKDNTANARRHEWIMDIEDYKVFEGIRVPSRLSSTWKLEEGDWTWLKMELTDITYNPAVLQP